MTEVAHPPKRWWHVEWRQWVRVIEPPPNEVAAAAGFVWVVIIDGGTPAIAQRDSLRGIQ